MTTAKTARAGRAALAGALACALSALLAPCAPSAAQDDDVEVIEEVEGGASTHVRGWLELARVQPVDLLMRAKLDTGALTSAIDADILRGPPGSGFPETLPEDVEIDDVGGAHALDAETIVFALESRRGARVVFEREIIRWVRIKDGDGGTTGRPVVLMEFCIGGVPFRGQVSLDDRSDLNYPLLVGRRMLVSSGVIVDPSETFTYRSRCFPDGPHRND